jgi:hypothetical protein
LTLELIHRLFLDNPQRGNSTEWLRAPIAVGAAH